MTYFLFSPRALLNNIVTILFHYLLPFFRQLHHFIFPKLFYLFEQKIKNSSRCLLQSSRELKISPLTEFCRDFPSGPVVKTWPSSVGASGSIPGWGARILHVSWPKKTQNNIKQKQYCKKFNKDLKKFFR